MADYTSDHAKAGIKNRLPKLDTWLNQFPATSSPRVIRVHIGVPKTGLPDYGTLTIEYMPKKSVSS
jgi:7-cyano-7-deazaguanine reductase